MSIVILICFGFARALLHFVIGSNVTRHFNLSSQSEVNPKPIVTPFETCSLALRWLHYQLGSQCELATAAAPQFGRNFDWRTASSLSFVIGLSDYCSFEFFDTQLKSAAE